MFRKIVVLTLLTAFSSSLFAASAEERAQTAIDTRQGLLKVVASYFGPIVGMARGQIPFDAAVVEKNAGKIAQLAPMLEDVFAMDTRASGLQSGAKDGIWEDKADFNGKVATTTERAIALAAAASQGKGPTMKAFGALGSSCKNCHESYREKDDS
ncbi:MAG: cytochrome c556 [Candidatus Azotimanducaceae bacterium]|jgi:cytochrome c556|tara:strand:+ start:2108 stop:2572 length:465 start_codon:yes stop_codon:yes gene_type:complete